MAWEGIRIAAVLAAALGPGAAWALRLETSRELLAVDIVATGLQEPGGMAADPVYGELYVAERGAHRISLIRDKVRYPIIEGTFGLSAKENGPAQPTRLAGPLAIAFDADGRLYVAESEGPARLLRFEPLYEGLRQAVEILTPWYEVPQICTSIAADRAGRLYVTTKNRNSRVVTVFGTVMVRDTDGNWRLVDYGPFADFCNVAVDEEGRMLVVGERRQADLSWYEVKRQVELRSLEKLEGLRHLALLADGTTLATLSRADGTWSVVEVDGMSGRVWEWVGGLEEIGGLFAHPKTGDLFVALTGGGKIMRLRRLEPRKRTAAAGTPVGRMLRAFEMKNAVPPPEWPEFFRAFIERLGLVRAVNYHAPRQPSAAPQSDGVPLTIAEFASTVPVVAAKVRARLLSSAEVEPDPIEEISFLLFYPNCSMLTQQATAPSVSLFWARHQSGRIERSRFLPNKYGKVPDENMPWEQLPEMLFAFPAGFFAPETGLTEDGLLRVYFLGMGFGPDYWIDLYRDDVTRSRMVVGKADGVRVDYAIEPFLEAPEAGGQTVLVAGLRETDMGWHNLGADPIVWKIAHDETPVIRTRHSIEFGALAQAPLPTRPPVAETFLPQPVAVGQAFSRRIVLRAASRWSTQAF